MLSRKPQWLQRYQAQLTLLAWALWERWLTWEGREDWRQAAMRKAERWGLVFVQAMTLGIVVAGILLLVDNYSTHNGTALILTLLLWGILAIHGCFNGKSLIKKLGQADRQYSAHDETDRVARERILALGGHLLADSLSPLEWRMTKLWVERGSPACKSQMQSLLLDQALPETVTRQIASKKRL